MATRSLIRCASSRSRAFSWISMSISSSASSRRPLPPAISGNAYSRSPRPYSSYAPVRLPRNQCLARRVRPQRNCAFCPRVPSVGWRVLQRRSGLSLSRAIKYPWVVMSITGKTARSPYLAGSDERERKRNDPVCMESQGRCGVGCRRGASVCVAAAVSIGLAYPEPVSSAALGPDWQCTRLALVFTSCARVVRAEPVATLAAREPLCRRGAPWRAASTAQ